MAESVKIGLGKSQPTLEFFPERGGILNALRFKKPNGERINVVASISDEEDLLKNPTFKNIPLFPFPNRLKDGKYTFNGQEYEFPQNEPERCNNLHGFGFNEVFSVETSQVSSQIVRTELKYVYNGLFKFYPFPSVCSLLFEVKNESELEVKARIENTGTSAMPVGIGWHPYFVLGESLDSLKLKLPKVKRKIMDSRALPTGEEESFDTFTNLNTIGDLFLDDCFELAEPELIAKAVIWSESQKLGLEVWQEAEGDQYQYMQVFTHPSRERIAVEPMTCNVNAFQNKEGLKVLQPGESFCANFGVRLITSLEES